MENNTQSKNYWAFTKKETLDELNTNREGLTDQEVKTRRKTFGKNEITETDKFTAWKLLWQQFKSPLIFILIIAGIVTLGLQDWVDSAVIFLAVFVNAALGFYQEHRAEEALEHLKSYLRQRTRVVRDGAEREIDVRDIVPGDIIHLTSGTRVPADARILETQNLQIEEAILTGESLAVDKSDNVVPRSAELGDRKNMVFGGTLVVGGSGYAVVVAVGDNTEIGKISKLVAQTTRERTPLQRSIGRLAWIITAVLAVIVGVVFVLGVIRGESLFDMFLIAVAMAVGSIPEALPVALTMTLAVGVERLAGRNAVVRKLSAAESLGSTTTILTDKTGTLTEAKMKLVDILTDEALEEGVRRSEEVKKLSNAQQQVLTIALSNTEVLIENPHESPEDWRVRGNPLESAIVKVSAEHGILLPKFEEEVQYSLVHPFNSRDKFSVAHVSASNVFSDPAVDGSDFFAVLGAPDILLEKSNVSKEEFINISGAIEELSNNGRRLLGVAIKRTDSKDGEEFSIGDVDGLDFVGILAFYDPIRPEISEVMKRVARQGVNTVMVTGDLKGTALSIAKDIGWDVTERNAISGAELKKMSDAELQKQLSDIRIFARVTPEDKVRIAENYKERGEVVAMTGDGVNDAASLKAADVGVAVGSGTDVAKDVADLVLLDDNFKTIVAAIEEGHRILSNIKKTIVYLLSDSLDTVLLIGGALLFGFPIPLTALQILWVNFFSDSFPALAFAFESKDGIPAATPIGKKRSRRSQIFDKEVKALILGVGIITSIILFSVYWWLWTNGFPQGLVRTFIFAAYGLYTLFLVYPLKNLRDSLFSKNLFDNKLMNFSVLLGIALMAISIYVPVLQEPLGTVPLPALWLVGVAAMALINISIVEVIKWVFRWQANQKTQKR